MRRRLAVLAVAVLSSQLAACAASDVMTDCGRGAAPHPEIGGQVLFTCADFLPSTGTGIYLLDVATGQVRPIIVDHAWNTDPSWSPDGTRIAYVSTKDGETALYVMDLIDSKVTRLTRGGGWNGNPTWSPDGEWIMFDSSRDGPSAEARNLFVVRPDGTDLRRVTRLPHYNGQPSWAPDGKRVAFLLGRLDAATNIFVMSADGTEQRQLTEWTDPKADALFARWSPDSSQIVFRRTEPDEGKAGRALNASLFVIPSDGGESRRLDVGIGDGIPDWSPDGHWIAFKRDVGTSMDLFVMRPDGTGVTRLTLDGIEKDWPRWRPR
jgi:TolB protein